MDREEMRRIVREQRAGYAWLREMEIEEMRNATPGDRLRAFKQINGLMSLINHPESREDDDTITAAWCRLRARYDAENR